MSEPKTSTLEIQVHLIRPGDSVLAFNFRPDRMRELSRALAEPGFEDVDRGLPCDGGGRARRRKELPMHALRAREHLERLRPHPIARKFCFHRLTRTNGASF